MKIINKFCLITILVFTCGGCKTTQDKKISPQKTCEIFFSYLNNNEYDKAKEYGTEQTKKIVNLVETLSKMDGGGKIVLTDNKSEFINCEINGKEAVCDYKTFSGDIQKVYLIKEKGHWLIDLRRDKN